MIKKSKLFVILLISIIFILAGTGVCNASASSKSFGYSGLSSAEDCVDYSLYGLDSLGYDPNYNSYGVINKPEILNWIGNTGNGYAFYIQSHGNSSYFEDGVGNKIYPSECGGNWDLVFLDFSDSAASSNYADAFNTTGYSNRCFIGWYDTIYTSYADEFGYYFWIEEVGTSSIYLAALSAAGSVPGAGTTPISFYGDSDYDGSAR